MQPWLQFWAPQLHFPLSGGVAQRIQPTASWFFESIPPTAGDGRIEQKAFDVASYGRQLGLITEVLLDLADKQGMSTDKAKESLGRLKRYSEEIQALKEADASAQVSEIEQRIETLKRTHKDEYGKLLKAQLQRAIDQDIEPPSAD